MTRSRAYYVTRSIVRAAFWLALISITFAAVYFVLVAVAITEQESWQ